MTVYPDVYGPNGVSSDAKMTYIDKKLEKGATWEMAFGQPLTKLRGAKVRARPETPARFAEMCEDAPICNLRRRRDSIRAPHWPLAVLEGELLSLRVEPLYRLHACVCAVRARLRCAHPAVRAARRLLPPAEPLATALPRSWRSSGPGISEPGLIWRLQRRVGGMWRYGAGRAVDRRFGRRRSERAQRDSLARPLALHIEGVDCALLWTLRSVVCSTWHR